MLRSIEERDGMKRSRSGVDLRASAVVGVAALGDDAESASVSSATSDDPTASFLLLASAKRKVEDAGEA